ncbi:MAG: hypothetical protein C5B54_03215 [Acidobacteria bacterium]|nr:MAG: hypothetical protein C5B54_03215 [Acidobacteriota bacterium]
MVLDQEGQRITGDRLELNLDSKLGTMYNVFGYVPPQIFFWGNKLDKLGDEEYKLYDGTFTECSKLEPHWKLVTSSARMTINDYVHFKNFTLEAKKVPIFYSPYMMWPIKRERATGFLFPAIGTNSKKGFYVGNSFFWAINRSSDSTFWLDHWNKRGWGGGAEYEYSLSKESEGEFKSYYADDTEFGKQWSVDSQVNQTLPADFRLASIVDLYSSFQYQQDFTNSFSRSALRSERAQTFLTRNWSYYSFNLLGDYTNTQFSTSHETSLFHDPELEFVSRSQKLGPTPFFWTVKTSFDSLGRGDSFLGENTRFSLLRYDVNPEISFPMTYLSWLTFTPTYGFRETYYTKSYDAEGNVIPLSLTRTYSEITLDLRGPNFNKIFDTPGMSYSQKWKHAIEPQITFHYLQDIPELERIVTLDEVDDVQGDRVVTYGITNYLYAKRPIKEQENYKPDEYEYYNPPPAEAPVDSPWEFISWRIQQSYSFQSDSFDQANFPTLKPLSPISNQIRINPSVHYNVDFRYDFDINFRQTTNVSIGATLRDEDKWYANVNYVYTNPIGILGPSQVPGAGNNQIRMNEGVGLWRNQLVLANELDYDIENRKLFRVSATVTYNADCFSIGLEWRKFDQQSVIYTKNQHQFTFYLSLPNIGGLVNYGNGQPAKRY